MKIPLSLEKMMFGFIESQILYTCQNLGIFSSLTDHDSARCHDLSMRLNLPESSLERLLTAAVAIGLLDVHSEHYRINEAYQEFFDKNHPHFCGDLFGHYSSETYKIFSFLDHGVRDNKLQWDKITTQTALKQDIYQDVIYTDESTTRAFLATMWASGYHDSLELCHHYRFPEHRQLVDLGGGSGSFAIAALQKNPELKAEIFDLAQVEPHANEMFTKHQVTERAKFTIGNMFEDDLPPADIYVIGYVLSDWPDDVCQSLIKKCYQALPANGLIIVMEKYLNEDKSGPYLTAMMNLVMLLEMHGRHRCYSEYMRWLSDAGFSDLETIYSSGEKNMIIGKKL